MPSRAHACCLPNLECEHLGEQQCYRQGGGWEPGGSIECSIDLCQDPDEHPISYEIMLSVTNAETLGALQFDVDYGAVSGGFDGSGSTVSCTKLAGDFAAFNDHEAEETLAVAMISLSGITGPIDLAICTFVSRVPPDPGGFPVTIIDQSRPDLTPAAASVAVTDVRALNTTSTTTTTVSN